MQKTDFLALFGDYIDAALIEKLPHGEMEKCGLSIEN